MTTPANGAGPVVIALDVGGTDIKGAVFDDDDVLFQQVSSTRARHGAEASVDAVLEAISDLRDKVPADRTVGAVGLAVPGTVDEDHGLVVSAENLGWTDLPLKQIAERSTGLPVGFGHDVRAGCLAEWKLGAGRGAHDHVYLSVGTGIAAGLVLQGTMYSAGGWSGEIGHGGATKGESCPCGGRGCAETFASAAGMGREYRRLTGASFEDVPGSREVLLRAGSGDDVAAAVWNRGVDRLGELVAELVRALGLRAVVVGGGLVGAGDALMRPLDAAVRRYLTVHPAPQLVVAELGSSAGMRGAALLGEDAMCSEARSAPMGGHRRTVPHDRPYHAGGVGS